VVWGAEKDRALAKVKDTLATHLFRNDLS